MGKKYIIELEEPEMFDERKYYQCSQMPWWAVSENIVENLTPYTDPDLEQVRKEAYDKGYDDATAEIGSDEQAIAEKAYQRGLNDAWEAARKIVLPGDVSGIYLADLEEIFDRSSLQDVIKDYSASECIEKIRQYERGKEEIKVGDEVINRNKTAVVTEITDRYVRIMYSDGSGYALFSKGVVKTGRHFPEIAAVLEKMRGEQDG